MRDMSHKDLCWGESFQYHVLGEKPFRILLAAKYAIEKVTLVQKLPSLRPTINNLSFHLVYVQRVPEKI